MPINRRTILAAPCALAAGAIPAATASLLSLEARRILDLERVYQAAVRTVSAIADDAPGHTEAEAEVERIEQEFQALCDAILDRPVGVLSDVVDRAIIARWAADVRTDGTWGELQTGLYDSAAAETALAVLVLAGITEGTVERGTARGA